MGRKRQSRKTKDLPKNLYEDPSGFRYRHPVTGKFIRLGRNRYEAIEAAKIANHKYAVSSDELVYKIEGIHKLTVGYACDAFKREKIDTLPRHKINTKKQNLHCLNQIKKHLNDTCLRDLTTKMAADFLRENYNQENGNASMYQKIRTKFIQIIDYSIRNGWIKHNPVSITETKTKPRSRIRWTMETYKATYNAAGDDLKRAMDFALYTAFGVNEIINLKFSDISEDAIETIRKKTGVHQRIHTNSALRCVISACRSTGIASPYVVHHRPQRLRRHGNRSAETDHWTQWTAKKLERELRKTRHETGLFDHVPPKDQPGFHCIRALAAYLLLKQGVSMEAIRDLLGHKSTKTTEVYLAGHEPEWIVSYAALAV